MTFFSLNLPPNDRLRKSDFLFFPSCVRVVILFAVCLTVENLWGLLTGDEGIGNAFPTVLPNADYSYYTLKTSGFKTF